MQTRRYGAAFLVGLLIVTPVANAWAGPPAICQPIDIGEQASLPFGKEALEVDPELPLDQVVPMTIAILDRSDDVLLHMETIRRAVITLRKDGKETDRLGTALEARLAQASGKTPATRSGLHWFDLGYQQGARQQMTRKARLTISVSVIDCFEKAISLRPSDAALHFGAALASWGEGTKMVHYRFMRQAVELDDDPDGLLRRNLLVAGRRFLGAKSYEELIAKLKT